MTFSTPPSRTVIAAFLLLLAVAIMTPDGDGGMLAPEPRVPLRKRFIAWLLQRRRFRYWPDNNNDPDEFVAELQGEQPLPAPIDVNAPDVMLEARPHGRHRAPKIVVRRGELVLPRKIGVADLPSMQPRPRPPDPDGQLPPWDLPAVPVDAHPDQPEHHDDAPTIVRGMRAIMAADPDGIGHYLDRLPGYTDET